MEAKVMLVMAIRGQEEGGLAREVLEEQLAMGFPGLGQEVSKEEVKEAIRLDHLAALKSEMAGRKKLEALHNSDMRQEQEYVNWSLEECRMAFRLQNRMFDCRSNMTTKY